MKRRTKKWICFILVVMSLFVPLAETAEYAVSGTAVVEAKSGWVTKGKKKLYYRNGEPVRGVVKIKKKWYYFSSGGYLVKKNTKCGKTTYYCSASGILEGIRRGGTYYYANGRQMSKADISDFTTLQRAKRIVKKITTPGMSREQKIRAAFDYVIGFPYKIYRPWQQPKAWEALYANDHFVRGAGDCHADACAFGYLCKAIGCKNVIICVDAPQAPQSHCWAKVDGFYYDPLFAEAKNYDQYYHMAAYVYGHQGEYRIPVYSPKHAVRGGKVLKNKSDGLVKKNGSWYYFSNGKALKNKWKKIGKNKYYFKKNGKAATGSTKIKKKYYVFRTNGKLVLPKKTATVRIKNKVYRVKKNGRAAPGWQGGTYYYAKNGARYTGDHLIGGKLYAFGEKGKKNASRTRSLQKAAVFYEDAGTLITLLGEPESRSYGTTCLDGELLRGKEPGGKDGIFEYDHIVIATYLEPDGTEPGYLWTISGD